MKDLKMVREYIIILVIAACISGKLSTSSFEIPCNPFVVGEGPEVLQEVIAKGEQDPNACLCTFPCTVDKVAEYVRFYYIKRGMENYLELDVTNPFSSQLFNYKHSLKFLIHGYVETAVTGWLPPTGKQLVKDLCGYVILVDYGPISNCSYERSAIEIIPSISTYVANVIKIFNFDPHKMELIALSNGAHVAGYIGAALNGEVQRITALEPAGPVFDDLRIGLNKTNARFVQVMHTDAGGLGTTLQRGDVDFYANNRSAFQPGCTFQQCSHEKSTYFYFASLFPEIKFYGTSCGQISDTNQIEVSRFGEFNDGKYGQFCFDTTPCFPYAPTVLFQCENEHSTKKGTKSRKRCDKCKSKQSKKVLKPRKKLNKVSIAINV